MAYFTYHFRRNIILFLCFHSSVYMWNKPKNISNDSCGFTTSKQRVMVLQCIIFRFCYKSILHRWFYFKWHPASAPCWMFQLPLAIAWQTWLHFVVTWRYNFVVMNNSGRNGLGNYHVLIYYLVVLTLHACDIIVTWVLRQFFFKNWLRFIATTQAFSVVFN